MALTKPKKKKKIAKKEQRRLDKKLVNFTQSQTSYRPTATLPIDIQLPKVVPIKKLAEMIHRSPAEVLKVLLNYGVLATINESIDSETAMIIGGDLGYVVNKQPVSAKAAAAGKQTIINQPRPPVVTVMGHVDHGKTALLDKIRQTDIMASESGGITQHMGAYQTLIGDKIITFLDTPGHEVFSAMRAHGANVTDIVLLVVAADEGVKPQTLEAISHAQAAAAPIIVAINKIDKPEANVERVKAQLTEAKLVVKEWGGKIETASVSAKTGQGINELLKIIIKKSQKMNLRAVNTGPAKGVIIESHLHAGAGPLATAIITTGVLHQGDALIAGSACGKARRLENYLQKVIKEVGPGLPVRISGLATVPGIGEILEVVASEREAREIADEHQHAQRAKKITFRGIQEVSREIAAGELKELNLVFKADVKGSEEAILDSLNSLNSPDSEAAIKVISSGVGPISQSDVLLASSSQGLVIGFRVGIDEGVEKLAKQKGLKISCYEVIYELLDDINQALAGLKTPKIIEEKQGRLKIKGVFRTGKAEGIAGGVVTDGFIKPRQIGKIRRGEQEIGELIINSIQQNKRLVEKIDAGFDCGFAYAVDSGLKLKLAIDDIIELYQREVFK